MLIIIKTLRIKEHFSDGGFPRTSGIKEQLSDGGFPILSYVTFGSSSWDCRDDYIPKKFLHNQRTGT